MNLNWLYINLRGNFTNSTFIMVYPWKIWVFFPVHCVLRMNRILNIYFFLLATSSGGGVKRKHSEMENSSPTGSSSEPTSRISLGQLQERHPATQVPSQHGAAPPTTAQSARPLAENRAIIFPQDSRDPKRRISKEFAQEFHESVLQTTRQQQEIARRKTSHLPSVIKPMMNSHSLAL